MASTMKSPLETGISSRCWPLLRSCFLIFFWATFSTMASLSESFLPVSLRYSLGRHVEEILEPIDGAGGEAGLGQRGGGREGYRRGGGGDRWGHGDRRTEHRQQAGEKEGGKLF